MPYAAVNLKQKLALIDEPWSPRGVRNTGGETNDRTAANDVWV